MSACSFTFSNLETRTGGSPEIWLLLKNACMEDAKTAQGLIEAADLTMPYNSLTTCIDSAGVYYRVPIACINDPLKYEENSELDQLRNKKKPEESMVKVSPRSLSFLLTFILCEAENPITT